MRRTTFIDYKLKYTRNMFVKHYVQNCTPKLCPKLQNSKVEEEHNSYKINPIVSKVNQPIYSSAQIKWPCFKLHCCQNIFAAKKNMANERTDGGGGGGWRTKSNMALQLLQSGGIIIARSAEKSTDIKVDLQSMPLIDLCPSVSGHLT